MVRESLIPASESLDAAVLAAHRRHVAQHARTNLATGHRPRLAGMWQWPLAAAVVLLVVGLYWSGRTSHRNLTEQETPPTAQIPPVQAAARSATPEPDTAPRPAPSEARQKRTIHSTERVAVSSMESSLSQPSLAQNASVQTRPSAQQEFRSLMYCDPMSCDGPMELIHVQLPSSLVANSLSRTQRNGFVNADVLVGRDGIARAIRFEE